MKDTYNEINAVNNILINDDIENKNKDEIEYKLFPFDKNNKWHMNIKLALDRLGIRNDMITWDQMRSLNWFHTIHRGINKMASLKQVSESLELGKLHGAVMPHHYLEKSDANDGMIALSEAQKEMDIKIIHEKKEIGISEDGNQLRGKSGRGYMTKCIHNYELIELFIKLEQSMKSVALNWSELETIDSGLDNHNSMMNLVTNDLKKKPENIASIATDWSGSNSGCNNGSRAHVGVYTYILFCTNVFELQMNIYTFMNVMEDIGL